jgi:hypothetical protein
MAESAQEWFETASQVLTGAKFKSFGSTNDLLHHLAWGGRSWLMGEQQLAAGIDDILSRLKSIEEKLDRIDRSRGFGR